MSAFWAEGMPGTPGGGVSALLSMRDGQRDQASGLGCGFVVGLDRLSNQEAYF
jgi:hypothetical protein